MSNNAAAGAGAGADPVVNALHTPQGSSAGISEGANDNPPSGLNSWNRCEGYLEKRSRNIRTFNSRYFVLENGVLHRYTDSDKSELLESVPITSRTIIEALPPEPPRNFIFAVISDSTAHEKIILSAATAEIMEMWMISLIQTSQGTFSQAENFDSEGANEKQYEKKNAELSPSSAFAEEDSKPSETYYVNDATLMGRLRKANVANPEVHLKLNNFYMQFFSSPCEFPGFILIRVCENQRYLPIKGWNCLNLFPTDPAKLSSEHGEKFPYRYFKTTDPPLGYHWPEVAPIGHAGWCVENDEIESGWRYAPLFSTFSKTPMSALTKKTMTSVVRRRIWRRYAQLSAELVINGRLGERVSGCAEAINLLDENFCVTLHEGDTSATGDTSSGVVDITNCIATAGAGAGAGAGSGGDDDNDIVVATATEVFYTPPEPEPEPEDDGEWERLPPGTF